MLDYKRRNRNISNVGMGEEVKVGVVLGNEM